MKYNIYTSTKCMIEVHVYCQLMLCCAGLVEVKVESVEEAMLLLRMGLQHRHVASTRLNYQSSRSHTIFTIKMMKVARGSERPHNAFVNR